MASVATPIIERTSWFVLYVIFYVLAVVSFILTLVAAVNSNTISDPNTKSNVIWSVAVLVGGLFVFCLLGLYFSLPPEGLLACIWGTTALSLFFNYMTIGNPSKSRMYVAAFVVNLLTTLYGVGFAVYTLYLLFTLPVPVSASVPT